jgi:hypothetical protein
MIQMKQNDTRPATDPTLNRGGTAINLTDAASVTFKLRYFGRKELKVNSACVITDAVNGKVEYRWQAGDTDTPGKYHAEYEVLWLDGSVETFPTMTPEVCIIWSDLDE